MLPCWEAVILDKDLEIFLPSDDRICTEMVRKAGTCRFITNGCVSISVALGVIWTSIRYAKKVWLALQKATSWNPILYFLLSPRSNNTKLPGFMSHWAAAASLMFFSPLPPPPVRLPERPPPPHSCSALRGAVPLWFFCSCRTLMGACLLPLHLLPVATGSLKMTSCCLPVVSRVGL